MDVAVDIAACLFISSLNLHVLYWNKTSQIASVLMHSIFSCLMSEIVQIAIILFGIHVHYTII